MIICVEFYRRPPFWHADTDILLGERATEGYENCYGEGQWRGGGKGRVGIITFDLYIFGFLAVFCAR